MNRYCQTCQKSFTAGTDAHIFCSPECAHAQLPAPRDPRTIMQELRPFLNNTAALDLFGELTFSIEDLEAECNKASSNAEHHESESTRYAAMVDGLTETIRQVQTGWRDWSDLTRAADDPHTVALYPLNA